MSEKDKSIRPDNDDILKMSLDDAYLHLMNEDMALRAAAQRDFSESLSLFDGFQKMNLYVIRTLHGNQESWATSLQRRLIVASIMAAFNDLLFARHAVLLGYYLDSQLVLRRAQEWIGRAMLFHQDTSSVDEYVSQGRIEDKSVRIRLQKEFTSFGYHDIGADLKNNLQVDYSRRSELGHASFAALAVRSFPDAPFVKTLKQRRAVSEHIGLGYRLGGHVGRASGFTAFLELIKLSEMLLQIGLAQIPGPKLDLDNRYREFREAAIRHRDMAIREISAL